MNQKKRYTHLFFDLDNTLWDFNTNSFHAMQKVFAIYNLHFGNTHFQLFYNAFVKNNSFLWEEYRNNKVVKKELIRLRFQYTFNDLNITGINPEEMNQVYLSEMPKQKKLVDGAKQVLDYLKSKGYVLSVISNGFASVQYHKLDATGIKHYFGKIYISEEIKSPKPARKIFDYALKSSNARKKLSLMIGDDLESDVKGALNFGIDAVLFDPDKKYQNLLQEEYHHFKNSLYTINALSDLCRIV